jgi:hypothetical protein
MHVNSRNCQQTVAFFAILSCPAPSRYGRFYLSTNLQVDIFTYGRPGRASFGGGLLKDHLLGCGYGLHRTQEESASGSEPNHKWLRASVADLGLRSADDYKYWCFVHDAAPAATGSFKPDERTSHLGGWSVWLLAQGSVRGGIGAQRIPRLPVPCPAPGRVPGPLTAAGRRRSRPAPAHAPGRRDCRQ